MLTLLEVAERRQQADADVDGAVAHREDPAVAGQRVAVAVADVERALDPRVGVQRALVVRRGWPCPAGRSGCGPCRAPGRTGSWSRRRSRRSGRGSRACRPLVLVLHHARRSPARRAGAADGLGALRAAWRPPSPRARRRTGRGRGGAPRTRGSGTPGARGQLQLERDAVGDGPQAVEAVEVGEAVVQAHVGELLDRPGREAVAAGLLAGEALALDARRRRGRRRPASRPPPRRPALRRSPARRGGPAWSTARRPRSARCSEPDAAWLCASAGRRPRSWPRPWSSAAVASRRAPWDRRRGRASITF